VQNAVILKGVQACSDCIGSSEVNQILEEVPMPQWVLQLRI